MEQWFPVLIVCGDASCQLCNMIFMTVPASATVEELRQRIVLRHHGRVQVQLEVDAPTVTAFVHLLEGHAVQVAVGQLLPLVVDAITRTPFFDFLHCVVAQFVATAEKVGYASGDAFLLVEHGAWLYSLVGVGHAEYLAYLVIRECQTVLVDGSQDTGFFGQSGLSAGACRQAYNLLVVGRFAQGVGQTGIVRNAHFAQCRYVCGLIDEAFAVESCLFLHF